MRRRSKSKPVRAKNFPTIQKIKKISQLFAIEEETGTMTQSDANCMLQITTITITLQNNRYVKYNLSLNSEFREKYQNSAR
jgi:hypothetical protein